MEPHIGGVAIQVSVLGLIKLFATALKKACNLLAASMSLELTSLLDVKSTNGVDQRSCHQC